MSNNIRSSTVSWLGATPARWNWACPPETHAGRQVPTCPYVFAGSNDFFPLLQLNTAKGEALVVGAAWPAENAKVIFRPTWAMMPFLLTPDRRMRTPDQPVLDAAGRALLLRCLKILKAP